MESEEINALNKYMTMPKKEQLAFIKTCTDVDWDVIEKNKDGSCKKPSLTNRIQQLKMEYEFLEDSYERKLLSALRLSDEVFDKIGALATRDHRSITNYIEYVLLKHLEDVEREQGPIEIDNTPRGV